MRATFAEQLIAAALAYQPSRRELLQIGRMQAELGLAALAAGDLSAAHLFLVDALDHLNHVKE
jgi:hypothetical protein